MQCIYYMLRLILTMKSSSFPEQHFWVGLCNGDAVKLELNI
jgi:hypothetical protein